MDAAELSAMMNDYLQKGKVALAEWLMRLLPRTGEGWWEECVLSGLKKRQLETVQDDGITRLDQFDLAALLRIADRSWYALCGCADLPAGGRELMRDMIGVRNNWAHRGTELPGKDTIISDIETLTRFFTLLDCDDVLPELRELKQLAERPNAFSADNSTQASAESSVSQPQANIPTITERSLVYLVGSPQTRGMVFSVTPLAGTTKYEVFVDGELRTFYEGQIAPVDTAPKREWVSADILRCRLTAWQINNPSAGKLYSLNSARIDFVPYQFRPALKLIKADEPRILIADSVGVGKTIEAGLIIKELEARSELGNIMVVCPKPLVVDRKWESEMKRFDEEFIPLNGDELRQAISDTDRDGEWPARFSRVIVPYSILDERTYQGTAARRGRRIGLVDLDPAPRFDLVIIDEAHHLRNGSMDKEKAFAYKCVHFLCEHAAAVVMLTATPLQTSDDDLYTLLNLLRPDVVIDKPSFAMMARPNPCISACARAVRLAKPGWQAEALEALDKVLTTQWGEDVIARNPTFEQIRGKLQQDEISRDERVELITDIESLHSFNMMLNRTRRKDIQDFCIRRTHTMESEFTPAQRELHDALLSFEVAALSKLHGGKGVKFMMSTIRRQASSCIFGLAPHIRAIINRRFDQLLDDPDSEYDVGNLQDVNLAEFRSLSKHILELADNLPTDDPKFDGVLEIIREKQVSDNNKIILFSTFRYTLYYVLRRLKEAGIRAEQIDGSVGNDERVELRNRFELPKDNPDAIDVLLFTEVGSEGLDYQFCDTMINYDLPWNPMRIEQRIGRIDRRGQRSEVVNIYNAITKDTVDADIYERCLARIGVFEGSIGECEEILGEIGQQIEKIALDAGLTVAERRAKLEQMADNEVRKAQELNRLESEEKELFGFDLSNLTVSKEIRDAESPFLTAGSLQHLVEMYLSKRLGAGNYLLGEAALKTLRLSATARAELLGDLRDISGTRSNLYRQWEVYLKGSQPNHAVTFDAETADKERGAFFITPVHPLVRQAAGYFAGSDQLWVHFEYCTDEIPGGDYVLSVYAWDYTGIRTNFRLVTICDEERLTNELPEYILTAASIDTPCQLPESAWDALEEKHIHQWQAAREKHIQDTRALASYKIESLRSNFGSRKAVLEPKIRDNEDMRIKTMYSRELENAAAQFKQKVSEIKAQITQADIHTTLIAKGVITVRNK